MNSTMILKIKSTILLLLIPIFNTYAQQEREISLKPDNNPFHDAMPASVLLLSTQYSHHVAIVEKSSHRLYLFANEEGTPVYIKTYKIATGKTTGDKFYKGDLKTPEGIYHFVDFLPKEKLEDKYGVGAFVINYPNTIDLRKGKTGGGIWLHATNDNSRVPKQLVSRGCVVVVDQDLKDFSKYVEFNNTPIIIVQDLNLLKKDTWHRNKNAIVKLIDTWSASWQEERFEDYIKHYSPNFFADNFRGNYQNFAKYKRAVFSNPGTPKISISQLTILYFRNYALVQFRQNYESNAIKDVGRKTIYLTKNNKYKWEIVAENWHREEMSDNGQAMAFTPKNRFFIKDKTN